AARPDLTGDADAPLRPQIAGDGVRRLVELGIEHQLRDALAVAEVDEHAAAVIAVRLHPTGQDDVLADVAGAQGAAAMSPRMRGEEHAHGRRTLPRVVFPSSCDQIRSLGRSGI